MTWSAIARKAQSLVPARQRQPARLLYFRARSLFYRGAAVHCPCCGGRFSRFAPAGEPPRPAACPACNSLERQRLLYLYLAARTRLFEDRLSLLHVAPEDCLQPLLCARPAPGCPASPSDRVLVNRLAYEFGSPQRGQIVVFDAPPKASNEKTSRRMDKASRFSRISMIELRLS